MFQIYVDKLHSLTKVRVVPEEFLRVIVGQTDNNKLEIDCFSRGLLDLTPRNIFVNGDKWIVLDNEWSFDFPVPVVFVLFRAIRELAFILQSEIRRTTRSSNPTLGVFARGLSTYYVPVFWANYLTRTDISLTKMLWWEMGFQRYVTGSYQGTVGRIKRHPKICAHFSSKALTSDTGMLKETTRILKAVPGMRKLVHFFEREVLYLRK